MTKDLQRFIKSEDFGLALNCAVRYACGRRSYMPYAITSFIKPMLPMLSDRTLFVFAQDIEDQERDGSLGDDCDVQTWKQFYKLVKDEMRKREDADR